MNPSKSTKDSIRQRFKSIADALHIPEADPVHIARRIRTMELNIMLPLKVAGCFMLQQSEYFKAGLDAFAVLLHISPDAAKTPFWLYLVINAGLAAVFLGGQKLSLNAIRWTAVASSFADGLFLAAITTFLGGFDSIIFWLFFGLIIRNAISVPQGVQQHALNLLFSLMYAASALVGTRVALTYDEDTTRRTLGLTSPEELGEPLFARMMVLWLTAACCHAVQMMLEHQRHAADEAREFATRESQLRSAGRLAARIAHQIKNPLGIINNAAFSLRRAVKDEKPEAIQQIDIIREEVARADQIITELMGYAQLTEGRVERLKITEELDSFVEEVFPSGIESGVKVHRDYEGNFPPLLMQRKHVSEVITNLLQNAREAMNGGGNVFITAHCRSDYSIEVTIRDDGPGVPRDKLERIFEAYYTTKERGTGLGLAIVKQNMELYGGTVRVESELGKGACFTLLFPAKTLTRLTK